MEGIADRLIKFINYLGINNSTFADEIDVQRSGISHILSGRNKPSLEFLQKLFSKYPTLNSKWLIMGQGNMLSESDFISQDITGEIDTQLSDIPPNKKQTLTYPEQSASPEPKRREKSPKAVKKVIILYNDDTFHEYSSDN